MNPMVQGGLRELKVVQQIQKCKRGTDDGQKSAEVSDMNVVLHPLNLPGTRQFRTIYRIQWMQQRRHDLDLPNRCLCKYLFVPGFQSRCSNRHTISRFKHLFFQPPVDFSIQKFIVQRYIVDGKRIARVGHPGQVWMSFF